MSRMGELFGGDLTLDNNADSTYFPLWKTKYEMSNVSDIKNVFKEPIRDSFYCKSLKLW